MCSIVYTLCGEPVRHEAVGSETWSVLKLDRLDISYVGGGWMNARAPAPATEVLEKKLTRWMCKSKER